MKLSVLMPVYNERKTLDDIIDRVLAVTLPSGMELEIVAVDDASTDGSDAILKKRAEADKRISVFRQAKNMGKGAAIRTAVQKASGDIAIIQDADLEYDPSDYGRMIRPILDGVADVVYGSRFASSEYRRVLFFWHSVANRMLTTMSNMFTDLNLTDMETCYKAFRMSVLKTIPIRSNRFGIEPEITAKIAKRRLRIFETGIRYSGRTYLEGKKIGFKDAVSALWTILKYYFVDDLYDERYGAAILHNMETATRFTDWLMKRIKPYLSGVVLEVGAGIGNNVRAMLDQERVIATEPDPEYIALLQNQFKDRHRVEIMQWDVTSPRPGGIGAVDSVLCSNVLEHIKDEKTALVNIASILRPDGRAVLVVPAGEALFGTVDLALEHLRRYNLSSFKPRLAEAGLEVEKAFSMNKAGVLGWLLNGKILRRKILGRFQLKVFNMLVPVFKVIDPILPWTGLSLVVVAKRKQEEKQKNFTADERRT